MIMSNLNANYIPKSLCDNDNDICITSYD